MPVETLELMVEAGKATPNATVAQKLGPTGINISEVINKINEKTLPFKGMQVPVKLKIEIKTKDVDIEIGTPPTTQLIKKELNLEKGSGQPDKEKIANIAIEQCIKIAKMKIDSMYVYDLKQAVKSIVGSCNSLGILTEGKTSSEIIKDINEGKYDNEILKEKTEVSEEKKELLQSQLEDVKERLAKELARLKAAELAEVGPQPEVKVEEAPKEEAEQKATEKVERGKEEKKTEPLKEDKKKK